MRAAQRAQLISIFKAKLEPSRPNWNVNGQRRWVCFWTNVRWASGPWRSSGAAVLQVSCKYFCSPEPETSLCCKTTSTEPVHHTSVFVYTPGFASINLYCMVTGHVGVDNLPRVITQPEINSCDLLIVSPTSDQLHHQTTQNNNNNNIYFVFIGAFLLPLPSHFLSLPLLTSPPILLPLPLFSLILFSPFPSCFLPQW